MKMHWTLMALLAIFSLACGRMESSVDSELDGYFATKRIADSFLLHSAQPDYNAIYSYIIDSNPNYNDPVYSAFALADTIQTISTELDIDAFIFASLIRKESTFKREAVSPTNAVGFTQMTNKAISEVNDQLGARGANGARPDTTTYLRGIAVPTYELVSGNDWVDLWTVSNPKTVLKADGDISVIYGAVMLKTLLAVAKQQKPNGTMVDWYTQALESYNGDVNKAKYRKQIMDWAKAWSDKL